MGLKPCSECGKEISTKAKACPSCGAPVKAAPSRGVGCGCLFLIVMLGGAWFAGSSVDDERPRSRPTATQAPDPDPVSETAPTPSNSNGDIQGSSGASETEILRSWRPDDDPSALGVDLLITDIFVDENRISGLVTGLAKDKRKAVIRVYSSRDAYEAEKTETYGEAYKRGYVAFYVKNKTGSGAYKGYHEIRWMQEVGPLDRLFGTTTKLR